MIRSVAENTSKHAKQQSGLPDRPCELIISQASERNFEHNDAQQLCAVVNPSPKPLQQAMACLA